jgi:hypothetical protein
VRRELPVSRSPPSQRCSLLLGRSWRCVACVGGVLAGVYVLYRLDCLVTTPRAWPHRGVGSGSGHSEVLARLNLARAAATVGPILAWESIATPAFFLE